MEPPYYRFVGKVILLKGKACFAKGAVVYEDLNDGQITVYWGIGGQAGRVQKINLQDVVEVDQGKRLEIWHTKEKKDESL